MNCTWTYPGVTGYWEDEEPYHRETQILYIALEEIPWGFKFNYAELKNIPICALLQKSSYALSQEDLVGIHHICNKFFDAVERAYP